MTLNWFLVGQERLGWPLDGQDAGFPLPNGSRLREGSFKSSAEHCHEGAKMRSAGQHFFFAPNDQLAASQLGF